MRRLFAGGSLAILLVSTACGQRSVQVAKEGRASFNVVDVEEPAAARAGPQIAYTFEASYLLKAAEMATVQSRHLDLCRSLGSRRCLILRSSTSRGDDGAGSGSASLVVDARIATAFNNRLDTIAGGAGGTISNRTVVAEDVTKQLIDTDARVRAKEALAARLLALIQSTRGNVGELVAAEKAFAETQEELEAARGLQASLRQRVAMSQIDITYSASEAEGTFAPVRSAVGTAGTTLAESLRVLITATIALLPWVLALVALRWIGRRLGWRGPIRRFRDWRARRTPD